MCNRRKQNIFKKLMIIIFILQTNREKERERERERKCVCVCRNMRAILFIMFIKDLIYCNIIVNNFSYTRINLEE